MGEHPKARGKKRRAKVEGESEDAALASVLRAVDRLVESLEAACVVASCDESGEGRRRRRSGPPRSMQTAEAELAAAQRLRDGVDAAVAIARGRIALVEADAVEAIEGAFRQFAKAIAPRKKIAPKRRSQDSEHSGARSSEDLAELAGQAKDFLIYAIVDRDRLARGSAVLRTNAAALRRQAEDATADPHDPEGIRERIAVCEGDAAYLEEQYRMSVEIVEDLKLGFRKLFETLPPDVAKAVRERAPQPPASRSWRMH